MSAAEATAAEATAAEVSAAVDAATTETAAGAADETWVSVSGAGECVHSGPGAVDRNECMERSIRAGNSYAISQAVCDAVFAAEQTQAAR